MSDILAFASWRNSVSGSTSAGVWLLFCKTGGPKARAAAEAPEEALCFGWIDGQLQRIGSNPYRNYFSLRREKQTGHWSKTSRSGAL